MTPVTKDACISPCGKYRYTLDRRWDPAKPPIVWIMLNPSTADADNDDSTIRRCIGISRGLGAGGIVVVNLFAYRATDPRNLPTDKATAIGPRNDAFIQNCTTGRKVMCAWGINGAKWNRGSEVVAELKRMGEREIVCLGTTKYGHPRHPLCIRANPVPVAFTVREGIAQ